MNGRDDGPARGGAGSEEGRVDCDCQESLSAGSTSNGPADFLCRLLALVPLNLVFEPERTASVAHTGRELAGLYAAIDRVGAESECLATCRLLSRRRILTRLFVMGLVLCSKTGATVQHACACGT